MVRTVTNHRPTVQFTLCCNAEIDQAGEANENQANTVEKPLQC
jgi:hypothetical protein